MTQIYPKSWKALTTARRWRLPLFFFSSFFSLMGPTNSALWWLLDITSNLLHLPLVMPCEEWLSELHFKKFLQCCSSSSPGFSHKPFCSYCCFLTYKKISWQPSFLFPPPPPPPLPVYFFFSHSFQESSIFSVDLKLWWHALVLLLFAHEWAVWWVIHLCRPPITQGDQKAGCKNQHSHQGSLAGTWVELWFICYSQLVLLDTAVFMEGYRCSTNHWFLSPFFSFQSASQSSRVLSIKTQC